MHKAFCRDDADAGAPVNMSIEIGARCRDLGAKLVYGFEHTIMIAIISD